MALAAPGHRLRDQLRGPSLTRLRYLDGLRGVAILLMVEAHVVDAWTRDPDRAGRAWDVAVFAGGLAAPLFLFLAGVGTALFAQTRLAAGLDAATVAAALRRRGWQILLLALLFRLQALLLGWGALVNLLRVDILNAMGPAMVAGATIWHLGRTRSGRLLAAAAAAVAVAMLTPLVWDLPALAVLPDPLEAYLRPAGGLSQFPLFPWAGFLLAGVAVGEGIAAARGQASRVAWLQAGLLLGGAALALGSWWAAWQPSIYVASDFWTNSPAFFGIRLGLSIAAVAAAWAHFVFWIPGTVCDGTPAAPLAAVGRVLPRLPAAIGRGLTTAVETMGRSSLFVYWVHVEMVYGLVAYPLEHRLPLALSLAGTVALAVALHALVTWKNRRVAGTRLRGPWRVFEPVLK